MVAGCGGGSFGTDVPPETVFDEASPDELEDLCVAISNEMLDLVSGPLTRTFCTAAGVAVQSDIIRCSDVRRECIEEAEDPEVTDCDNIDADAFDACDTTVGEVETCMNQLRANVQAIENQVSCNLEADELDDIDADDILPAACAEIGEECPALGMLLQFDVETEE